MTEDPNDTRLRRFEGRRALVTGASRGIGAGIAERLAAEGADVALVARTRSEHAVLEGSLEETAARCEAHGARSVVIVADITRTDDRERLVGEAVEGLGGSIDVLVNNAAAAIYQPMADYPLKRRHLTFEANVHAPLDLAQAVLPSMIEAGEGWILNLSSGTARPWDGPPFEVGRLGTTIAIYGASKRRSIGSPMASARTCTAVVCGSTPCSHAQPCSRKARPSSPARSCDQNRSSRSRRWSRGRWCSPAVTKTSPAGRRSASTT